MELSKTSGSAKLRRKLLKAYPGQDIVCNWCGLDMTLETATVDHLLPREDPRRNKVEFLVWACEPCNQARGIASWHARRQYGYQT